MQDLTHVKWYDITRRHWFWFTNNNAWAISTDVKSNHLLANSLSLTDLIFTDQPSLGVDCSSLVVHPSLHLICHHQNIYCKLYKHANANAITKALDQVDWNFLFINKNV